LLGSAFFGLVDAEIPAQEVGSVHLFDGFARLFVVGKSDKGKSARAVCFPVERDEEVFDGAVGGEGFTDVIIRSGERQIAEIQFHSL
jgi:hypothetical protein